MDGEIQTRRRKHTNKVSRKVFREQIAALAGEHAEVQAFSDFISQSGRGLVR